MEACHLLKEWSTFWKIVYQLPAPDVARQPAAAAGSDCAEPGDS